MTETRTPVEMELQFSCKDPLLSEYYQSCFKDWFTRELSESLGPGFEETETFTVDDAFRELVGIWNRRMTLEAEIMEHYDYDEFTDAEHGKQRRFVRRDGDGQPLYLIPTVTFVPK